MLSLTSLNRFHREERRAQLAQVLEGEPELPVGELRGLLVKLGAQRVLQELLEAEQREYLGADRYERSEERQGRRNGYEPLGLDTAEGRLELWAPQVRDSEGPFQSRLLAFLRGRTEVVERLVTEMYVHGLSTRDIEAAFTDATGGCILSRSVVSEVRSGSGRSTGPSGSGTFRSWKWSTSSLTASTSRCTGWAG